MSGYVQKVNFCIASKNLYINTIKKCKYTTDINRCKSPYYRLFYISNFEHREGESPVVLRSRNRLTFTGFVLVSFQTTYNQPQIIWIESCGPNRSSQIIHADEKVKNLPNSTHKNSATVLRNFLSRHTSKKTTSTLFD